MGVEHRSLTDLMVAGGLYEDYLYIGLVKVRVPIGVWDGAEVGRLASLGGCAAWGCEWECECQYRVLNLSYLSFLYACPPANYRR